MLSGKGSGDQCSSLDWMSSESRAILLLSILIKLIWKEGYSGAKTVVGNEGTVTHISHREMTSHFCGLGKVCVFNRGQT